MLLLELAKQLKTEPASGHSFGEKERGTYNNYQGAEKPELQ